MIERTQKRRKPYPSVRQPRKTVFTPAMWAQWLVEQAWTKPAPDDAAAHLRTGIAEFRDRLRVVSDAEAPS
jgi:hypothetical protein